MADTLVLPVPETLTAVYLVPATLSVAEVKERVLARLPEVAPDPLATIASKLIDGGLVKLSSVPASGVPPLPVQLQQYLGVEPAHLDAVMGSESFGVISATWVPGWPPMHELAGRACAAALAVDLAAPVVDTYVPQVLTPERAVAALPRQPGMFRLASWVLAFQSASETGLWFTTKGLGRFGLPELQVCNVPPQYGEPWNALLTGIAARLLRTWTEALGDGSGAAAFVEIPRVLEFGEVDVARAYGSAPHDQDGADVVGGGVEGGTDFDGGTAVVGDAGVDEGAAVDRGAVVNRGTARAGLTLDPAADDGTVSFLTVGPPADFPASAGEYCAGAVASVLGSTPTERRYLPTDHEAMRAAIVRARSGLAAVRERFVSGELPLRARLMVKHRLDVADGSRTEYPWAYVNSWDDPTVVLANSAADAAFDPSIRAGRPIAIHAEKVVDWAIWIDGEGIVEGGLTNRVAMGGE